MRRNEKDITNEIDEVEVKAFLENRNKRTSEKPKIAIKYPSCKQRNWFEFDKRNFRQNCELIIN